CHERLHNMGCVESHESDYTAFQMISTSKQWWRDYIRPMGSPSLSWEQFTRRVVDTAKEVEYMRLQDFSDARDKKSLILLVLTVSPHLKRSLGRGGHSSYSSASQHISTCTSCFESGNLKNYKTDYPHFLKRGQHQGSQAPSRALTHLDRGQCSLHLGRSGVQITQGDGEGVTRAKGDR
ncbi:hypothetical protein HAX54_012945, partial [Datura stramonium]|nr:hypothetical protein [Datura stramonium]